MKYIEKDSYENYIFECQRCGYRDSLVAYRLHKEKPEDRAEWMGCDRCNKIEDSMVRDIQFLEWLDDVLARVKGK